MLSALAPPPTSRKFAGLRAGLRHDVERRHDEARAVADDPDVAVELHVLQAPSFARAWTGSIGN